MLLRLWCGPRPQRFPGVKAAGPLEPLLAFGFYRGWLSTWLRVRLGRGGHLCQLLVDLAGPFPGLGELGGLGGDREKPWEVRHPMGSGCQAAAVE